MLDDHLRSLAVRDFVRDDGHHLSGDGVSQRRGDAIEQRAGVAERGGDFTGEVELGSGENVGSGVGAINDDDFSGRNGAGGVVGRADDGGRGEFGVAGSAGQEQTHG